MNKIVGFKKFTSNKNLVSTNYCVVNVLQPFSNSEKKYNAVGEKVVEVWLVNDMCNLVNDTCLGKEVKILFEKVGNKFQVSEFVVSK